MRRRQVMALLAATATAALAGCGDSSSALQLARSGRPVVLTTFTVIADMARQVAGDRLEVVSLTKVGAEVHGYEPTPGDIAKAVHADLVLVAGMGLDAWFDRFLQEVRAPHVTVSAGVEEIAIRGDVHAGAPNPHAWMSPAGGRLYVQNMIDAFCALDPGHAAAYAADGAAYQGRIQEIEDELTTALAQLPPEHRVLVTCEGAFSYLARDAGLEERYLWPVNAEQQATPQQVAGVIEAVRARQVPAVFCESTVSDRPMQQVVEATGTRFGGTLYVDSLSAADGPVPTYLDLLRHDTELIVAGLRGESA
ncbi:metal ABC transporter substrate-binding protein [Brachybacterium hainanense]|uniref:Metal ABC transporter substrate-binding protein n=1 Tax=Brachybacterium hainanense TaxID=1541174 RepID=A0ABV6RGE9_9MICO